METRVKKVMQSDEDIGRMVASVPVAVGRVVEHFVRSLLRTAADIVAVSPGKTLTPAHIKTAVLRSEHLRFMDTILEQVPSASTRTGNNVDTNESLRSVSSTKLRPAKSRQDNDNDEKIAVKKRRRRKNRKNDKFAFDTDQDTDDGEKQGVEGVNGVNDSEITVSIRNNRANLMSI